MSKKINFQFEDSIPYQNDAVESVVDIFKGTQKGQNSIYRERENKSIIDKEAIRNNKIIGESKILKNLNEVQNRNSIFASSSLDGLNFTIEMETGTGKTYVYLKTILRLYKEYGLKKFMLVVPSMPIIKGVQKSIEQLDSHFYKLFNINIKKHSFVLDTNNLNEINTKFIEGDELSICIVNYHKFNSSKNKLRTEQGEIKRILWNEIKYVRPILIIDEPQKMEGNSKAKSKALVAIEELNPLFTLRYSATHINPYNKVYELTPFDAFSKNIVKKIGVKTVNSSLEKNYPYIKYVKFTNELKAKIEIFCKKQGDVTRFKYFEVDKNASLEELSGLSQYKDMFIQSTPNKEKPLIITKTDGSINLEIGQDNANIDDKDVTRIQIRLAIQNHFEKQIQILSQKKLKSKIKCLTLFFIDKVEKVRDLNREDKRGEYLRIFDEEYNNYILKHKEVIQKYNEYFKNIDDVLNVREGYFAIDKKGGVIDKEIKENVKAKDDEDIARGISLILDKKDELISFDEPLQFIFSHSALREGWDNPNVFTICTLKTTENYISKRQELGRGLRLPVDINGARIKNNKINELTIIANESYESFSEQLQKEYKEDNSFNRNEITFSIAKLTLKKAGIEKEKITPKMIDIFRQELIENGVIDNRNILTKTAQKIIDKMCFKNEILNEHSDEIKNNFFECMEQKGSNRIEIKKADNPDIENKERSFVTEDEFKKIYEKLCENLTKRAMYKCNIDKDKFIDDSVKLIDNYIENKASKVIEVSESKASFDDIRNLKLNKKNHKELNTVNEYIIPKTDFEIANEIMYHTMLPRLAIFKILQRVKNRSALSSQETFDNIIVEINKILQIAKAEGVKEYKIIEGYNFDESRIFELDNITDEDLQREGRVFKSSGKNAVNEYYKMDSLGELEFAKSLESNSNVLLFTKLKKGGFVIDTPYGNYSPDWAIICKGEDDINKLYFIVETKADKEKQDLTDVEKCKIKCGELHFKAVSNIINFHWVNSYKDFKNKAKIKDVL